MSRNSHRRLEVDARPRRVYEFALTMLVIAAFVLMCAGEARAAFTVTGFSVNTNLKQAAAHPNVTVSFNRNGSNTEDLRDFSVDFPSGMIFNPNAAVVKCSGSQFSADTCPGASIAGDFSADANLEILGFSFPVSANGSIYILEPSGLEHATIGYILRPTGYNKTYSKQVIQLRSVSDGGARTVTTNQMRTQASAWPRAWGTTNIAIRKLVFRYNARTNAAKTGPYFTLNPSSCAAATATLQASSYSAVASTGSVTYTPTGCASHTFSPTMTVEVDNPESSAYTGVNFNIALPMADAAIQQPSIKTVSALLPLGTDLNTALLGTYAAGCTEAELLSDSCPVEAIVGEATANMPFFPPAFTGEVYLMDPVGATFHGAILLRGPRGIRSILRFSNSLQGSGASARVLSDWDYVPQIPISRLQVHVTEPLFKNADCPGGAQPSSVTFTSHSNRTRSVTPSYSTSCLLAPPAPPTISDPSTGTPTNDTTPTLSGTAVAGATITIFDGAVSIGTTTSDAAGDWTFTPSASIGIGVSSITATATTGSGTSSVSNAVVITVDTTAPLVPVITTEAGPTYDNTPIFGGTSEDFAIITIRDGASLLGTASADASGIWSFTASALADGPLSVTATATDGAGNISLASQPMEVTIDTVAPAPPSITTPVNGSTTADNSPEMAGGAEIGSTVRVARFGNVQTCKTTTSITGAWSCEASPGLPVGSYVVTAVATDAAGNSSTSSAEVAFSVSSFEPVRITTGPEGGLPIDVTHWDTWYYGGTDPFSGELIDPHPAPQWSFAGAGGAVFECSLVDAPSPDSFSPCTSPYTVPFASLNDSVPEGTEYRFTVRDVGNPSASDAAEFVVAPFNPTWNVELTSHQAMDHPDMTMTFSNPAGSLMEIAASTPAQFWGSLAAIADKCSVASAEAGTCATTAPNSRIGSVSLAADINPNPHNETVSPHQVSKVVNAYLTPAAIAGDAAGIAISVRMVDDPSYGSRDYGTINYIVRLRLRYRENVVDPSSLETYFGGVSDPTGMELLIADFPESTLAGPGIIAGPAGAVDLQVRNLSMTLLGDAPWYSSPLLWNASTCPTQYEEPAVFEASIISRAFNLPPVLPMTQDYRATGCEGLEYEPVVTQFSASDNGATDLVNDLNIGVGFPAGNSTTRSLIVDLPREFQANSTAVQACPTATLTVQDPQTACPDTANLGTVTITTPLLPSPLVGDVIGEDVGDFLPNFYFVFKDPDIGLDARIRGSADSVKTGDFGGVAQGAFIRTRINLGSDDGQIDLPSIPLTSFAMNLHQEDEGVALPDGTTSSGPILKIGSGYDCNDSGVARFILRSWSGLTRQVMGPAANFDCDANGQTPTTAVEIISGPADGAVITQNSVSFELKNNLSVSTRLRAGIDDGSNAIQGIGNDGEIEPNNSSTPTVAAGNTRVVGYSGLVDGRVYKFLVQNTASDSGPDFDQERRVFKVNLNTGPPQTPTISSPSTGLQTNDNTVTIAGTADPTCTIVLYDGAPAIGSTTPLASGDWAFTTSPLTEGVHSLAARCVNSGGDQSPLTADVNITVDTIPPTAPEISSPTDAQLGTVSNIVGSAEPNTTVTVREGATVLCSAAANESGGWMCAPEPPLAAGNHVVCAKATDVAGNTGVSDCVQFGDPSAAVVRIATGPEGGLPVIATHDLDWYNAGNVDAEWSFEGGGESASYECSLVKVAQADSYAPCMSPYRSPFGSLDDSVPLGTDYRFRVRIVGLPLSTDTALFKVGQFAPTWNVGLSTLQAMGHPDMSMTLNNPFGDPKQMLASTPDNFMGSLAANPIKCSIASAQAGTCAATAPKSKIGTVTFTADVNPVPHNDEVPPHQVIRTYDMYLTPATVVGDAAGIAIPIRAIDDSAYGSLDYGTINYIARMKLRYDGPDGNIDYQSVFNPRGMNLIIDDIPNSTRPATGVWPGPAGVSDLHIRGMVVDVDGIDIDYASPLLYNSSSCDPGGNFITKFKSTAMSSAPTTLPLQIVQPYQATGCENIEYEPSIIQFGVSHNGATDVLADLTIGVYFPEGNATTRSAIVELPREFVTNLEGLQTCPSQAVLVEDPQESCPDTANIGSAIATSPLLPYTLTGDVIAEDIGGSLPNMYMVFKDPDIGLDTRIRGSQEIIRTGGGSSVAAGDFIRSSLNVAADSTPAELPSIPLTSLVVNLHKEVSGTVLPDETVSSGPILKVGSTHACNDTSVARFILKSWNGITRMLMSSVLNWDCAANGQTPVRTVEIMSGPANGEVVETDEVTFEIRNNHTTSTRLRTGIDDGTNAQGFLPADVGIEPNAAPTISTPAGGTRSVTFSGLQDGKVYKFMVQNSALGSSTLDQERRTFKVELP